MDIASPPDPRRLLLPVALLAFSSGMAGLVYEVLSIRLLTTGVGDMYYAHVTLVAVFLLGIGLGARAAHRFLARLWLFEVAAGLWAMALPALFGFWQDAASGLRPEDPVLDCLVTAALFLAVPAVAMGVSVPLFADYLARAGRRRTPFGTAYVLYNLGAALTILLAELILVRELGVRSALLVVGALNVAAGLALRVVTPRLLTVGREGARSDAAVPPPAGDTSRRELLTVALTGLAASLFAAVHLKLCYHLFLPHRENFALCTAVNIAAIAGGTLVADRLRLDATRLVAVALVAIPAVGLGFGPLAAAFREGSAGAAPLELVGLKLGVAVALGAVPYGALTAVVPALLRVDGETAVRSGRLLLATGLGSAVGYAGGPLAFFPRLDVFAVLVVVLAVLLLALAVWDGRRAARRVGVAVLAAAAATPLLLARSEEGVHLVRTPQWLGNETETFKHASDHATLVRREGDRYLTYNGHLGIVVTEGGRPALDEHVSGVLPALLAPRRERAMVLGLGTGMTGGTVARLFGHTDVVEINRSFFALSRALPALNFAVAANPRARLVHDDARRFLARTGRRYDVILNSVPSPTFFSAGKIYTREFFGLVRSRLRPGGVYSTWFTGWDMSPEGVRSLFATLAASFDHCGLALLSGDYFLASCSDRPLRQRPYATLGVPEVDRFLEASIRWAGPADYVDALFVGGDVFAGWEPRPDALNTDDLPLLEFQIMRYEARGRRVRDMVTGTGSGLRLEPRLPEDPEAFVRVARIVHQLNRGLYDRFYRNRVESEAAVAAIWRRRGSLSRTGDG